jgi:hypothetical protein
MIRASSYFLSFWSALNPSGFKADQKLIYNRSLVGWKAILKEFRRLRSNLPLSAGTQQSLLRVGDMDDVSDVHCANCHEAVILKPIVEALVALQGKGRI